MSRTDLWIATALLGVALGLQAGGCERTEPLETKIAAPRFVEPLPQPGQREQAVLEVRELGEIRIELLADRAPATVENFKKLARSGFYDGTTFHRIIPSFMIQGGDPNTRDRDPRDDGTGGPGYTIEGELSDTAHVPGVVSMAHSGSPDSAGSQFFIVVGNAGHLDGEYSAFGLVVEGMQVVREVARAPRDLYGRHGPVDRPLENVVIESVRIEPPGSRTAAAEPDDEAV
jgi:cyclophilin family peptidyl-prolyl cis-trans isomerase